MRQEGTLSEWNDERGFGFIVPFDKAEKVFVHISSFITKGRRPLLKDKLSFEVEQASDGKTRAVKVKNESLRTKLPVFSIRSILSFIFVSLFFAFFYFAVLKGYSRIGIIYWYALTSVLCFGYYWKDKRRAKEGEWRIDETSLHLFELVGGWPGALLAQRLIRHKSRKSSYQMVFWLCVLTNITGLIWFHSQQGVAFLNSLLY